MDIHIRMEPAIADVVREISKREDRSLTKTVNRLLRESLRDNPLLFKREASRRRSK